MTIQADVSWREQYVSHALNRKFTGIIPPGVYAGFDCSVTSDGNVTVGAASDQHVAVVEVNGYSITVRMDAAEVVATSLAEPYIVIDANYAVGVATRVELQAVAVPAPHQIVLGRAAQSSDASWWVDESERQNASMGIDAETLAKLASAQIETMEQQLALHERVYALEQAASSAQ